MALRLYRDSLTPAMRASRTAADRVRAVAAGTGDLTLVHVELAAEAMGAAKMAAIKAIGDLQTSAAVSAEEAAAVDAYLGDFAGPATLAAFQSSLAAVEAAAVGYNTALATAIRTAQAQGAQTGVWMLDVVSVTIAEGVTYGDLRTSTYLPAAFADPFRQSPEVAALIAAFEAAGA